MPINSHALLGIAATCIALSSAVPYLRSVIYGTTRPHIYSQIGWSLLSAIPALAQFSKGADWSIVIPTIFTFNCLLTLGVSVYYKKYLTAYHWIDTLAFLIGIMAIAAWVYTNDPVLAIYISIIGDAFFTIPTITKTYRMPESEALLPWALITLSALCGILAVSSYAAYNLAYPIYSFIGCGFIAILASRQYWGTNLQ